MKSLNSKAPRAQLAFLICLGFASVHPANLLAQTAAPAGAVQNTDGETVVLSPFVVTSEADTGYRATNSISGTRLNTPIKDTPMPIEVVTRQFLDDTGATDLRSALKYSSGVILQSQNDLSNRSYQGPGGVNNPEGATANTNAVQIKLRGFVTDNVLREGFIRQNSTDSANIERVEVVRGPAALFYGTGNFGGVVNYMVKRPLDRKYTSADVTYGSHNFIRGQIDTTGPLSADKKLSYRVTGAVQRMNDQTEYFEGDNYFISPYLLWRPSRKTEVHVDLEYGEQDMSGVGARQLRSVANVGINNDQNEQAGLYTPPGGDPRSYRVTGPDTYQNSQAGNLQLKATHELFKDIHLLVGYNRSTYNTQGRDVQAQLFTNVGPVTLRQTIELFPLSLERGTGSANIQNGSVPGSIIRYTWDRLNQENTRDQYRYEVTAKKRLFESAGKWVSFENQILAGYSDIKHDLDRTSWATAPDQFNYKAPLDLNPMTYAAQGDGSPTIGLYQNNRSRSISSNKAFYASYQGKFFDDRLLLLLGGRRDTNDSSNSNTGFNAPGAAPINSSAVAETQRENTYQKGLSFRLTRAISLYALQSEGLQPNFSGQILPESGAPAGASLAKSDEFGLKFDFMDGRVSGTISRYRITRIGYVTAPWYAPVTLGKPRFDPTKDIVFNVSNWTPTGTPGGSNGGAVNNPLDDAPVVAAFNAGVASGAIFQSAAGNGTNTWYVNASRPEGAAYMDSAFLANAVRRPWTGFLYNGQASDSLVNNATQDTAAFRGDGSVNATLLTTDESEGYDAQVLIKATKNLQLILNGAVTEVQRVNFGQWMAYPHLQDRWAVWNYRNGSWGTLGFPPDQVYGTPGTATQGPATETRTGIGQTAGDDTPRYRFDFWANYQFSEGSFKGLSLGLGGYWETKREFMSGVSHGSGQLIRDREGQLLVLFTEPRYNLDAMMRYDWNNGNKRKHYVQLNINNLLNDQDFYGLIYASGINARISYGLKF